MTDSITFGGLHYLAGETVAALVAGLDCGDYTVDANGQITVLLGSDPDGFLTASYLLAANRRGAWGDAETAIQIEDVNGNFSTAYVPVVVGLAYSSRGQILRPFSADEIKSGKGPGLGKRKRAHMVSALLHNTAGISFGTTFSNMQTAQLRDDAGAVLAKSARFSGVYWDTLPDDYTFDTMIAWEVARPYPAVVCQLGAFINSEDE